MFSASQILLLLFLVCFIINHSSGLASEAQSNYNITSNLSNTYNATIDMINQTTQYINPPTIGILTLPSGFSSYSAENYSYVYTSYIQYFQQTGARIVLLKYTDSKSDLRRAMSRINGLVIPGGGTNLMQRNEESGAKEFTQFAETGRYLVRIARQRNDRGLFIPVWGTCLGFELLVLSFSKREQRSQFYGESHLSSIEVSERYFNRSRLLSNMSQIHKQAMESDSRIFFFNHKYGFSPYKMTKEENLSKHFIPLAYGRDLNGKKFVAITEAKNYPFYGVQFHPEKIQFESFLQFSNVGHQKRVEIAQYFANFFFSECQKSLKNSINLKRQKYPSQIEKYMPVYINGLQQGFYIFENDESKIVLDGHKQNSIQQNNRHRNSLQEVKQKELKNNFSDSNKSKQDILAKTQTDYQTSDYVACNNEVYFQEIATLENLFIASLTSLICLTITYLCFLTWKSQANTKKKV